MQELIIQDRRQHSWSVYQTEYGTWTVQSISSLPNLLFSFEDKSDAIAFCELIKKAI